MRCPSYHHDNRSDCRFCTQCGTKLAMGRPSCGAPTEVGEKFCGGCGAALTIGGRTTTPSPAHAPLLAEKIRQAKATVEGERKQVTVLFADVKGSMELAEKAKVDRIACPWLISKFVDSDAEFVFLPQDTNWSAITDGRVFDVPDAELGHHGEYCSFDAIIVRYHLDDDAALVELAKIVRAAGTPKRDWAAEGIGLEAVADGFRRISADDFDNMRRQFGVFDALCTRTARRRSRAVDRGHIRVYRRKKCANRR